MLRMGQGRCVGEGKLSSTHSCSALILTLVATVNGGSVSDPGLNLSFSLINVSEIVKIVKIVNEEIFYKFYKFLQCKFLQYF